MFRKVMSMAAIGAACAIASPAHAVSTTQPGETVGVAAGAPLPPGVYFVNTLSWGERNDVDVAVDIPVLAWSTGRQVLGANLQFLLATPFVITDDDEGLYNVYGAVQFAWDLGQGWGASYAIGGYTDSPSDIGVDSSSFNQRFALSYTANGWNLTANLIHGIQSDDDFADFVNLDLTATKKFGKWELGLVAFGGWDLEENFDGSEQERFAIGALVGYDFGRFTLQGYVTQEISENDLGEEETRFWTRAIVPLRTEAAVEEPEPYRPLK
jgi:hypothetical protein